jgi:hypothetical protein
MTTLDRQTLDNLSITTALQSLARWHMVRTRPPSGARPLLSFPVCPAYTRARLRYRELTDTLERLERFVVMGRAS